MAKNVAHAGSWRAILEEVGQKPSKPEWEEKYGIPAGTPWKTAAAIRAYISIIEDNNFALLPKIFEYTEPVRREVQIDINDWRTQFENMGVPIEIVADRLQQALSQIVEERLPEVKLLNGSDPTDGAHPSILEGTSRSIEFNPSERPDHADDNEIADGGEEAGSPDVATETETETPTGQSSL
jgi:hypothetical protein